jgi:hypothetical protein
MKISINALGSTLLVTSLLMAGCGGANKAAAPAPASAPVSAKQKIEGVLLTSLSAVPGWTIAETKGVTCYGFGFDGNGKYWDKFAEAQDSAREDAKKAGANAWINIKVSASSFEAQGSKWHMSVVHLCGDLVVLK